MLKSVPVRRLLRRSGPAALLLVLLSARGSLCGYAHLFTAVYDGTGTTVRVDWEVNTETDVTGL